MSALDEIRKKKLEEYSKKYLNGGNRMEKNWPDTPVKISDANIDDTIKKYDNVVVDCWAPWCAPCNMLTPTIEQLAKELKGKVVFAKLNVDENQQTSAKHQIMSIPTLLVFKNGNLVDRLVGVLPKEVLKQKIQSY